MGKEEVEFEFEVAFESVAGFSGVPKGVGQVAITWARGSSAKGTTAPAQACDGSAEWSPAAKVCFVSHLFKDAGKTNFDDKSFELALVAFQNKKEGKRLAGVSLNLAEYVQASGTRVQEKAADGAVFQFVVTAAVKKGKWQPPAPGAAVRGAVPADADAAATRDSAPNSAATEGKGAAVETKSVAPQKKSAAVPAPVPAAQFHPPPTFRRGELTQFAVHAHVIEARNLTGKDSSGMSDPMVEVKVKTKTQTKKENTTTKKETVNCIWDETLTFEMKLSEEEYRTGSIEVTVFDSNIAKNEMIGAFSFGLADTYMKEHREMHNVWVALGDPTMKVKGIQGYLKLSVRVLADADVPHEYNDDADDGEGDGDDIASMVLMPPDIKQQAKIFTITVGRCEGLPKMDVMGSCDGYVKAKFGVSSARTKTVKDNQNPTFNQTLILPVILPAVTDILELSIWDDDTGGDEMIAFQTFSVEDIIRDGGMKIRWINFYCVPLDIDKKKRRLMEPTQFCGRLACKIDISDVGEGADPPEPMAGFSGPVSEPASEMHFVHVDVWEAQEMCTDDKMFVQVTFNNKIEKTSSSAPKKTGHGMVAWYQGLPSFEASLSRDPSSNPKILIEVFAEGLVGRTRVGFVMIPFEDAIKNPHEKWLDLIPDVSTSYYKKGTMCGILLVKCFAGKVSSGVPPRSSVSMPKMQEFALRTFLYAARELPSADKSGFNDPYVMIRVGGNEVHSKILKQSNNPNWNEELTLSLMLPDNLKLAPPVQFIVMDKDQFSSDLIGRVFLDLNQYLVSDVSSVQSVPPPQRHLLCVDDVNQKAGELFVSAFLVPKPLMSQLKAVKFSPVVRACDIEIFLVGMRNLKPKGITRPLNKPWIEIDAGDKADKSKVFKSKCSDTPSKFNPNFYESVKFRVDIPEELCLVPKLSFTAIDSMLMREYNIGASSVPLAQYLPWLTSQQRERALLGIYDDPVEVIESVMSATSVSKKSDNQSPHVTVDFSLHDEENSNDETKPLLSGDENNAVAKARNARVKNANPMDLKEIEMEDASPDESDLCVAIQDDPILSRPLQKGLMEDWLGYGNFQEVLMYRGKVRGISEKRLKAKEKASGIQGVNRDLGVACGSVKFAVRVVDTTSGQSFGELPKGGMATQSLVVRVYVLRAIQLKATDIGGSSDPYLVLKYGPGLGAKIVDKKSLRKENLNPEFYTSYEFQANIPGDSFFELSVFDEDQIGSDDLIGSTKVDIENRWLNEKWKAMRKKPIETRPLFSPSSRMVMGRLEFWVDIFSQAEAKITPIMNIQPPVPEPFEVRLIIWRAKDVVAKDGVEQPTKQEVQDGADPTPKNSGFCSLCSCCCGGNNGSSDVFVTAQFEGMDDKQETDVHWGSDNGNASFNWRMKFDVMLPAKSSRLKIVGANDSIGECSLNLSSVMRKAYMTKRSVSLSERWLPFMHPNFSGVQGNLEISLEILPKAEAEMKPNGKGQQAPNAHPELPKPTGRKAAPWDVAGKASAMWEAHKWKIFFLVLLAVIGCGVGIWFYFTYGPGSLVTGGGGGQTGGGGGAGPPQ